MTNDIFLLLTAFVLLFRKPLFVLLSSPLIAGFVRMKKRQKKHETIAVEDVQNNNLPPPWS